MVGSVCEFDGTTSFLDTMKLFIIGNGFDLHHGLKTSYWDYKVFLEKNYPYLVQWFERLAEYSPLDPNAIWSRIEDVLNMDFDVMFADAYDNCAEIEELVEWVSTTSADARSFCTTAFINWLTKQYLGDSQPDTNLQLSADDFYISFNYTDTLQNTYSIPNQQVFHIHGSLAEYRIRSTTEHISEEKKHDMIQFGTSMKDSSALYRNLINSIGEIDTEDGTPIADFCDDVMFCTKRINNNINKLKIKLQCFNSVSKIIVMGCSMGSNDMPYFEQVLFPMYSGVAWLFYCHTADDIKRVEDIREKYNLKNVEMKKW